MQHNLNDQVNGLNNGATSVSYVGEDVIAEMEQDGRDWGPAGLGDNYRFRRYFTASVDYFCLRQESDHFNDDNEDHRIMLTIS